MAVGCRAKCLVVGDATTGKTALCQVFRSDGAQFPKNYLLTNGVSLYVKPILVPDTTSTVELYIYDCAGKDVFTDFVQRHFNDVAVIAVVFDVTNIESFHNSVTWLQRAKARTEGPLPVLVGNKVDLEQRRAVSTSEAERLAEQNGMEYFECSAKETQNVEAPFQHLASKLYQQSGASAASGYNDVE